MLASVRLDSVLKLTCEVQDPRAILLLYGRPFVPESIAFKEYVSYRRGRDPAGP